MSKYDPMTGELISEENEETVAEPVQTATEQAQETKAEAVAEEAAPVAEEVPEQAEAPMGASPAETTAQTGVTENAEGKIIGYDPMTGEPIREQVKPQVQEEQTAEMNFDPMTGKPIQKETQTQSGMNFDPMTGKPIGQAAGAGAKAGKSAKKGNKTVVLAVVAAVLVVAVLIIAGITSGAFLSKRDKVLAAMANTVEKTKLMENIDALSILASDSYTIAAEVEYDDGYDDLYLNAQYAVDGNEKQVSGSISAYDVPEIEFIAGITSSEVKAQLPDIDDHVFVYNYKEEKDGYITDVLKDDEIEAIDTLCETLYLNKEQEAVSKDLMKVVADEYKELKFEKADKEEFEVNGKDRKCKGYKTTITEDNFVNVLDGMEDILAEKYEDTLDEAGLDLGDLFDDLRDGFDDMEDMEVTFYIYKNKIACISMEVDREEVQLLFKGGEKNMPNIELEYEGDTVMELAGSVDGSVEVYELSIIGEDDMVLEYDYKSGEFVVEIDDFDIEGILESDSKGLNFSLDQFEDGGKDEGVMFSVSLSKGASMQKFEGEEFDVGNADKSDLEDLVEDIYSELY